jgi:hypothetical protein
MPWLVAWSVPLSSFIAHGFCSIGLCPISHGERCIGSRTAGRTDKRYVSWFLDWIGRDRLPAPRLGGAGNWDGCIGRRRRHSPHFPRSACAGSRPRGGRHQTHALARVKNAGSPDGGSDRSSTRRTLGLNLDRSILTGRVVRHVRLGPKLLRMPVPSEGTLRRGAMSSFNVLFRGSCLASRESAPHKSGVEADRVASSSGF